MTKVSYLKSDQRERYACGKMKPEVASPAEIRRIVEQAKKGAADARLGTVIGRLMLESKITRDQMVAAEHYAELCARYDRLKGMPRRSAASPSYQAGLRVSGSGDAEDEMIVAELLRNGGNVRMVAKKNARMRAIVRVVVAYDGAHGALKECGRRVFDLVQAAVLDDKPVESWLRPHLQRGLDALHAHFTLTGFRK